MKGWLSKCAIGCSLVVLSVAGTATVMSQVDRNTMPEMTEEEMHAMQNWMEHMTPSEHHEKLKKFEGSWNLTMRFWMDPEGEPQVNKATSKARLVMGGRYLVENVEGTIDMGGPAPAPFEGMSITAFDNHSKEWKTVWIDNMATGLWMESGKPTTDAFMVTSGTNYDAMEDTMKKTRSRVSIVDENTRMIEFYAGKSENDMRKVMEIRYERKR